MGKAGSERRQPTHVERLTRYAKDVVAGKIPAGKYVRLACQRHLRDLDRAKDKAYPFYFDKDAAALICRFAELLPHVKGQWARRGELIRLESWQCFLLGVAFGWKRRKNKRRRFREIYWEIPRKNGKSILGAVIGNFMFIADGEYGAEVYSGATSEKQAWEVFGPARLMMSKSEDILEDAGVDVFTQSMICAEDNSSFKPLIGNPGDGSSPSCAIVDEYHEHDRPNLYDTMITGMGAREQPLCVIITTAGVNLAGPCYGKHNEAIRVLEGVVENDELLPVIFGADVGGDSMPPVLALDWIRTNCNCRVKHAEVSPEALDTGDPNRILQDALDKHAAKCRVNYRTQVKEGALHDLGDDWADPRTLIKANPNFGISVDEDFLLSQQRGAVINVEQQNRFKTKHLNIWCSAATAWMNAQWWRLCGDPDLSIEEFKGEEAWFILDLATRTDVCAFAQLFTRVIDGKLHFYAFGRYYLPEATVQEEGPNAAAYRKWVNQGLMRQTDGTEVDFEVVREELLALRKDYRAREIITDDWQSAQLSQELTKAGATVVSVPLTTKFLSPAMREIEAAVKSGRFHHNGDPIMAWMMSNIVAREDANDNIFPRKEKNVYKIDIGVCLIMGVARVIATQPKLYQMLFV